MVQTLFIRFKNNFISILEQCSSRLFRLTCQAMEVFRLPCYGSNVKSTRNQVSAYCVARKAHNLVGFYPTKPRPCLGNKHTQAGSNLRLKLELQLLAYQRKKLVQHVFLLSFKLSCLVHCSSCLVQTIIVELVVRCKKLVIWLMKFPPLNFDALTQANYPVDKYVPVNPLVTQLHFVSKI